NFDQMGVQNQTGLVQTFNIFDTIGVTALNFNGASSANLNPISTGKVVYNVFPVLFGHQNNIRFGGTSTASSAIINAPHNSNPLIPNNSLIQFLVQADPSQAIITLHDISQVTFATTTQSSNGGPFITLFESAKVNVNISNRIASL